MCLFVSVWCVQVEDIYPCLLKQESLNSKLLNPESALYKFIRYLMKICKHSRCKIFHMSSFNLCLCVLFKVVICFAYISLLICLCRLDVVQLCFSVSGLKKVRCLIQLIKKSTHFTDDNKLKS